ncbi:DEAD-domain-containing protein [Daldinia caldariorum]|uniref:DEAD-domain-containing protein n=1 Tax=Daldinia caldariorum TaxID=326644 RepID=UPI002007CF6E|nr:DEAD-domain-containing protein [Daldinia caldariorum]KAI1468167.1 DEAD-domain-containing protein [Daldinia caldariorum]
MQEPKRHSHFRPKRRGNNKHGKDSQNLGQGHISNHPRQPASKYSSLSNNGDGVTGSYVPSTSETTQDATPRVSTPTDTPTFASLAEDNLVHPILLKTIREDLKFEHMTPVQAATIYPLLKEGCDMLAQAKTGTGKTIAFLLPAIQRIMNIPSGRRNGISLLVIAPTRELAVQIADEAHALLQRQKQYKVRTAIGGTNKSTEGQLILEGCDILVGTPGRLVDYLSGEPSGIVKKLQYLDTLVLDEADRLLDMGFLDSLKEIIKCLPDRNVRKRQSMLFSATLPEYVHKVSNLVLSKDYKSISTIKEGELNTHERIPQHLIVVPTFSDMAAGLLGALRQELAVVGPEAFKAIIFVPTARLVDFYVHVLQEASSLPSVVSLHSRMTQSKRTKVTEEFRRARSGIMVATDIIARGMDFPSVTNVFQAGIPSDKESYIHRLGRTGRAGAEGKGTFIITFHEASFAKTTLRGITFVEAPADLSARQEVSNIAAKLDPDTQGKAYQGWLGYYKSYIKPLRWDPARLVREANEFALNGLGAAEIPPLQKSTIGKMGLKGVPGLVVDLTPRTQML